jgi:DNA-directed RNA polymerase
MNTIEAPVLLDNEHMSVRRQLKADARAEKNTGAGATAQGLRLTQRCLPKLAEGLSSALSQPLPNNDKLSGFVRVVSGLDPQVIALCILQSALHSIGRAQQLRDTWLMMGSAVSSECWGQKLTQDNPKLAVRVTKLAVEKHGSLRNRRLAAEKIAAREGYKTKRWDRKAQVLAGSWLCSQLLQWLPEVFETYTDQSNVERLVVKPEADEAVANAFEDAVRLNSVFMPHTTPYADWVSYAMSEAWDKRVALHTTFLRTPHKDIQAACRAAIASGEAKPALDAVNSLQRVAWSINQPVLAVMEELLQGHAHFDLQGQAHDVYVEGLPKHRRVSAPPKKPYETMTEPEQRHYRKQRAELEDYNRSLVSDRTVFGENMAVARLLADEDRFYVPMNCDWRGRVYSLSGFNFQREDRIRSLLLFADGMPIGEDGLWWLKVHVANCGDFDKISKRPLKERVAWVDQHLATIKFAAKYPLEAVNWWKQADQPWMFLAAVTELSNAISHGPQYVTRLPVSFDGSCSGLQHLACLTRDETTAKMVNLTAGETPEDVYLRVAERVKQKLQTLAHHGDAMAKLWLSLELDWRKVVKRNVMVYSYSSKKYGMAKQQEEDLMQPLKNDVLSGKLGEHPFASEHDFVIDKKTGKKISKDAGYAAAKYIAGLVYETIVELVQKPARAMEFLQKCARALAHEGKPLRWTTPAGLPWINRYHEPVLQKIKLWLYDKGVKVTKDVVLAVDHKPGWTRTVPPMVWLRTSCMPVMPHT